MALTLVQELEEGLHLLQVQLLLEIVVATLIAVDRVMLRNAAVTTHSKHLQELSQAIIEATQHLQEVTLRAEAHLVEVPQAEATLRQVEAVEVVSVEEAEDDKTEC